MELLKERPHIMVEKYDTHNDKIRGKTENFYFGAMRTTKKRYMEEKERDARSKKKKVLHDLTLRKKDY